MIGRLFENEAQRDKNLQSRIKANKKQRQSNQKAQQETTTSTSADEQALETAASTFLDSVRAEEADQKKSVAELEAQRRRLLQNVEEGLDIENANNGNSSAAAASN